MEQILDICGTRIPYSEIREFRLVYREYIYRPSYREQAGVMKKHANTKYVFYQMLPFAAVLIADDKHYKLASRQAYAKTVKESIIKDVAVMTLSRIKSRVERRQYHCQNIAGRFFTVFLDDVPALLIRNDGKMSDVYKNDSLYPLLGEPIAPAVMNVPTLKITTKNEEYLFYGNGIQLQDVQAAYAEIGARMDSIAALKETRENRSILSSVKRLFLPGSVTNETKNAEEIVYQKNDSSDRQ